MDACDIDCSCFWCKQVYPECCEIEKHIQSVDLPEEVTAEVAEIFRERWDKMHSPLHALAYMLEPQFQGTAFGVEVRLSLQFATNMLCIKVIRHSLLRTIAMMHSEVSMLQVRRDFKAALKKLLPKSSEFQAALSEYTKFSNREGVFADEDVMSLTKEDSKNMIPTYQFWHEYGQYLQYALHHLAVQQIAMTHAILCASSQCH